MTRKFDENFGYLLPPDPRWSIDPFIGVEIASGVFVVEKSFGDALSIYQGQPLNAGALLMHKEIDRIAVTAYAFRRKRFGSRWLTVTATSPLGYEGPLSETIREP